VGTTPEEIAQAYGIPQTPQQQQQYYQSMLDVLRTQAQPRSDIITPGAQGNLGQARPYTFAGRVGYADQPESPQSMMQRIPFGEMETGGRAIQSPQALQNMMGLMGGLKGIIGLGTAYHGSPHLFDEFSAEKIGTGQGAQSYGHGLYFAENPEVAKSYSQVYEDRIAHANKMMANIAVREKTGEDVSRIKKYWQDELSRLKPSMYQVDIPDEHIAKMLDWDKPLSQQAPEVQKKLAPLLKSLEGKGYYITEASGTARRFDPKTSTGAALIDALKLEMHQPGQGHLDRAAVSAALNKLGIPGIKYLDQGSRTAGKGTSNYVVFDPKILKETKRLE
jgi:hypothetical protein